MLPAILTRIQQKKLRRLIRDAFINVPFYRERYARLGLSYDDLDRPGQLGRLPVISKADLLAASPEARINRRYAQGNLVRESTTGSTGQPFSLWLDRAYIRCRNRRFLSALMSAGYRPWQRLMLLTDRYQAPVHKLGGRHYVSVEQPTETILASYESIRPHVLYGFTTPLRLLAARLASASWRPRVVISTAEMLDAPGRALLERDFGCPVCDFYGLTEMGLAAWQTPGSRQYIMSPSGVLTEFLPTREDGCYRMVMTNLDLSASPLIRFDSGDTAVLDRTADPRIIAIGGRAIDTVLHRDGTQVSPYRITDAFRDVPALNRFKVTQRALDDFLVEIEIDDGERQPAAMQIETILGNLLGENLKVEIVTADQLVREGSRKFRPVESTVTRS